MACSSGSNRSGDKTENRKGLNDYWVFKTTPAILGVPQHKFAVTWSVYPNPTNGRFTINLDENISEIQVTISTIRGQVISSSKYKNVQILDLEINESASMYLANLKTLDGKQTTLKITKH